MVGAESNADALADVRRVIAALASLRDLGDLFGVLDREVRSIFDAVSAVVLGPEGHPLPGGEPGSDGPDAVIAAGEHAARTGAPVWLASAAEIAAHHPGVPTAAAAIAAAPLVVAGRTGGALALGFREPRRFDGSERARVEDVAQQLAFCMDRIRLVDEGRRTREQLEQAVRDKELLLVRLGHELRNPLAALRTAAELLRLGDGDEKLRRIQAVLERQTDTMVALVDDLLDGRSVSSIAGSRASPFRIMLVEDNEDTAALLQALLESLGYESTVAPDGENALDLARRFAPDVVLCDVGLPGLSGYDVARAFRGNDRLRDVFMVALTGYGRPEDVEDARAAGFDAHKTKPIDSVAIQELVRAAKAARHGGGGSRSIRFLRHQP